MVDIGESFAFSFHIHTEPDIGPITIGFVLSVPVRDRRGGRPRSTSAPRGSGCASRSSTFTAARSSTTSPSSGLFNTGAGTASGSYVGGGPVELLASAASGVSGLLNVGALDRDVANEPSHLGYLQLTSRWTSGRRPAPASQTSPACCGGAGG